MRSLVLCAAAVACATEVQHSSFDHLRGDVYSINVTVGTSEPPQSFSLLINVRDTMTWISSKTCPNCNFAKHVFDRDSSSTFKMDDGTFTDDMSTDGLAQVSGVISEDMVGVVGGGLRTSMKFGEVTEGRFFDFTMGYDGVLGLGFGDEMGLPAEKTFIQRLVEDGTIEKPVVSFYFPPTHNATLEHDAQGVITFGGADAELYQESTLQYIDVSMTNSENPWTLNLASELELNDEAFSTSARGLEITTGCLYSSAPDADVEWIAKKLGSLGSIQGNFFVPRNVTFSLNIPLLDSKKNVAKVITLTERELVVDSVFPDAGVLLLLPQSATGQSETANWVFGTEVLKTLYLVLDATAEHRQIGIAKPSPFVPAGEKPGRYTLNRASRNSVSGSSSVVSA